MNDLHAKRYPRPSHYFFSILVLLFMILCFCYGHFFYVINQEHARIPLRRAVVTVVGSSDLAINTAARYIRHVSLTDHSTPFQDCPGCLDYFPGAFSTNPPEFLGIQTVFQKN